MTDETFDMASAAPPALGGVGTTADATATDAGALGGFTLRDYDEPAWARMVAHQYGSPPQVGDLIDQMADSADLRAAATLQTLERLKALMQRMPLEMPVDADVSIKASDLVVAARALLSRLR